MKAVLFDLDGTLLDTRDMILNSFRYAYAKVLGRDALPPDDQLLSMIGIPLAEQMQQIEPDKSDELVAAYRENNQKVHETMLRGFAGTVEMLEQLHQMKLRTAVITSKRHDPAVHGLKLEGLDGYFEFLIGADDTKEHKPKPGPLLLAAERMGLFPSECAYVGDSPYDMQAARAAGMYAVGVLWGMFTADTLLTAGAEILVEEVADLSKVFVGQRK